MLSNDYHPEPIDILMLTQWDWANTGWRYKKALESMPAPKKLDIRMFKGRPHTFNYPEQAPIHPALEGKSFTVGPDGLLDRWPIKVAAPHMKALVDRAKCLWFQAETFIDTKADISQKHVVVTLAGATMREKPEKVSAFFNPIVNATVAQFPTLMGLGAQNEHLIYYPVDTDFIKPDYNRRNPDKVIICHRPSSPASKGTRIVLDVIRKLSNDPATKDRFIYTGETEADKKKVAHMDWLDNLKRMSRCDVLIETIQLEIGGKPFGEWGNTALEGSALGKIVVTNSLNEDLYHREYGDLALWIANDADRLEYQLRRAIAMNSDELLKAKQSFRAWAETNHSIPATGQRLWEKIYKHVF